MRSTLLALALLSCAPPPTPPFQLTPTHISTVGRLEAVSGGYGTAFPVKHTPNGFLVLTCHHVVDGDIRFTFRIPGHAYAGGTIQWTDERADTALVAFVSPDRPRLLVLAPVHPGPFSSGWAAGYPMGIRQIHVTPVLFQITPTRIDGLGAPGHSGGPVLNAQGEVAGLFRAIWRPTLDWGGRANFGWVAQMSPLNTAIAQL